MNETEGGVRSLHSRSLIGPEDLADNERIKYGDLAKVGWAPRMRSAFGYFTPDDHYEAVVSKLVTSGCAWLDVGCGRDIFPSNRELARILSIRCALLVGVDPDPTLDENRWVHQRVRSTIDEFRSDQKFDVITLRMVAEHIANPARAVAALARLTKPGGKVAIYTVNRWSPVTIASSAIPFWLHNPIKRYLWGTEEEDTFPVSYQMNTRLELARLFGATDFREHCFTYLDDCRTFCRFRATLFLELLSWRVIRAFRMKYPENCLLGVYERL